CILGSEFMFFFFFFQAEDGIRDRTVTGVQTCALPILPATAGVTVLVTATSVTSPRARPARRQAASRRSSTSARRLASMARSRKRSEERRVGKECRWRGAPYK